MSFGTIPMSLDDKPDGFVLLSMYEKLESENANLRSLCKTLLETYRLGAVTGEGADKFWCREMYDQGMRVLRELGVEVDE